MINVLLTCAGRRNYLLRYFREALAGQGRVYAGDSNAFAPALQEADGVFLLPAVSASGYVSTLLDLCEKYDIGLLVSLNDLELPILARHRMAFAEIGTRAVVSAPEIIETSFDKWQTWKWLCAQGIDAPATWTSLDDAEEALSRGDLVFPLVIKPRWGTASIGVHVATDHEELGLYYRLTRKELAHTFLADIGSSDRSHTVIIQQCLSGDEYGLDVVNDLDGNYVCTFVKRKLAMRGGETDRAITVRHHALEVLGERIGRALGHIGNLDCDVFMHGDQPVVLELNPRFGGGYPFSHIAGANLPAALVAWANGLDVDPLWFDIKPGVVASKYSELVVANPQNILYQE